MNPNGPRQPAERRSVMLHGRSVTYRHAGPESGPTVVVLHGIANTTASLADTPERLAEMLGIRVIAPDLFRSGDPLDKDPDMSLGGRAAIVRDLMIAVGAPRATIIGHSLGGGVALQFSYLFPTRVERLVLVASGGLGKSVNPILTYATLPGSELFLSMLASRAARKVTGALDRALDVATVVSPNRFHPSHREVSRSVSSLADAALRASFVDSARHVLSLNGQRISANDRLYLAAHVPVLLVHGGRDRIIPVGHSMRAHGAIGASRLVVFPTSGHFPHLDEPERFATTVRDFLVDTAPAELDENLLARYVV